MDRSSHTLACLFSQLGIDNKQGSIDKFIQRHRGIPAETSLAQAHFWNNAQAEFIKESLLEDSDWTEVIDSLDAMLR
ncbi:hypothetical protein tinsulaeT_04480 [Thalassotalea insulae]|uniref:DUF2789 domain-containing protein n=1 Tax=Thalassotalea insulae TaxID=2056778 RepID=A0ABQ6GM81_9GAMM|nr:DUF2789 family protein [Thalassotalea insulae]GLX77108.1 hypothetical protein tinsulaeT_04480 [Thalassotalea insulae]